MCFIVKFFSIFVFILQANFQPPGRRMVTSDINNYSILSFHLANFAFYIGFLSRTIFGYFSFWFTFFFVEFMKNSLHLACGFFNINTIIQISLILNFECVHTYDDKVKKHFLCVEHFKNNSFLTADEPF